MAKRIFVRSGNAAEKSAEKTAAAEPDVGQSAAGKDGGPASVGEFSGEQFTGEQITGEQSHGDRFGDDNSSDSSEAGEQFAEGNSGDSDTELSAVSAEEDDDSAEVTDAELIERYKAEAEANYDKYLRAVAELENYKKRAVKERSEILRYAGEHIARDILDVVDDLERALAHSSSGSREELLDGIRLIHKRFIEILVHHSIKQVDALGEPFDPAVQEALATVPSADHPPGVVMEQLKKAYFFRDKLLRPAQVVVSAASEKREQGQPEEQQ